MKRFMMWSSGALLLIMVGIVIARADNPRGHGWSGRGWGHHGPLGYVAHQLNLNHAQRSQIKSMWQAERPAIVPLVRELASEVKEMDSATTGGNLDETRMQAIAARQGQTIAKLLIEKERFRSKVYTDVLNPDQRIKADELQKTWHSRMDRVADRIKP